MKANRSFNDMVKSLQGHKVGADCKLNIVNKSQVRKDYDKPIRYALSFSGNWTEYDTQQELTDDLASYISDLFAVDDGDEDFNKNRELFIEKYGDNPHDIAREMVYASWQEIGNGDPISEPEDDEQVWMTTMVYGPDEDFLGELDYIEIYESQEQVRESTKKTKKSQVKKEMWYYTEEYKGLGATLRSTFEQINVAMAEIMGEMDSYNNGVYGDHIIDISHSTEELEALVDGARQTIEKMFEMRENETDLELRESTRKSKIAKELFWSSDDGDNYYANGCSVEYNEDTNGYTATVYGGAEDATMEFEFLHDAQNWCEEQLEGYTDWDFIQEQLYLCDDGGFTAQVDGMEFTFHLIAINGDDKTFEVSLYDSYDSICEISSQDSIDEIIQTIRDASKSTRKSRKLRKSLDWREACGRNTFCDEDFKGVKCRRYTMYCEYCFDCVYMLYANRYEDDDGNVIGYTSDVFNPVAQMYFGECEADSMEDAMRQAEARIQHYCRKSARKMKKSVISDFGEFVRALEGSYYCNGRKFEMASATYPVVYYYSASIDEYYEIAVVCDDSRQVILSKVNPDTEEWDAIADRQYNDIEDIPNIFAELSAEIDNIRGE